LPETAEIERIDRLARRRVAFADGMNFRLL